MKPLSQDETRALDKDERDLVDQVIYRLDGMSGADLSDLVRRLRDRRDRARDLADRQSREARGKAAPAGATPAARDTGMRLKTEVLTTALEVATAARDAVRGDDGDEAGGNNAGADGPADAEALMQAAKDAPGGRPEGIEDDAKTPHAAAGQDQSLVDSERRQAPSGAFDHSGHAPARERANAR